MDTATLTSFFMWCTIINVSLMSFWAVMIALAPNLVYRTQRFWFPLSKETFTVVMYAFLAVFKIMVIVLNLVPWIALLIVT